MAIYNYDAKWNFNMDIMTQKLSRASSRTCVAVDMFARSERVVRWKWKLRGEEGLEALTSFTSIAYLLAKRFYLMKTVSQTQILGQI